MVAISIHLFFAVLSLFVLSGQSAQLGLLSKLKPQQKTSILPSTPDLSPLSLMECGPQPLNGVAAVLPCICDCKNEHGAVNGICNKNGLCMCYYPGEELANATAVVPGIVESCQPVIQQCLSSTNPQAVAAFELGCNLDCMCSHGAPMGGTCDYENHFCRCNYTGIDKATTDNSGCPNGLKDQIRIFLKGFLAQATACALGSTYSCESLLTYPVLVPAAEASRCFDGAGVSFLKDSLNSVLAPFLPSIGGV